MTLDGFGWETVRWTLTDWLFFRIKLAGFYVDVPLSESSDSKAELVGVFYPAKKMVI